MDLSGQLHHDPKQYIHLDLKTAYNSDGLINCLLQPGLLYHSIQKSIREEFNPLIKSCATRTVPATETKSVGLQADAQLSWFLQRHLDCFIVTRQLSAIYRDLVPLRQFHRDQRVLVRLPGLCKNHATATQTATN